MIRIRTRINGKIDVFGICIGFVVSFKFKVYFQITYNKWFSVISYTNLVLYA